MIFVVLIFSMIGFTFFYLKGAQPAKMEKETGKGAYSYCAKLKGIAHIFTFWFLVALLGYRFFPLFPNFPLHFSKYWSVALLPALALAIPGGVIKSKANLAKGTGSQFKSAPVYTGIYKFIRHPQSLGYILYFLSMGFFLDSPFLVMLNLLWIPIFYYIALVEERDLLLRYQERYSEYMQTTGFMLPKRGSIRLKEIKFFRNR